VGGDPATHWREGLDLQPLQLFEAATT